MAEITMQELMEKEFNDTEETILMTDNKYRFGLTTEQSNGITWYNLYKIIGIPDKYDAALIRVYHDKDSAIAAFNALTVDRW